MDDSRKAELRALHQRRGLRWHEVVELLDALDATRAEAQKHLNTIGKMYDNYLVPAVAERDEARTRLADAQTEIARHHADFERWEGMAARGAGLKRDHVALMASLGEARTRITELEAEVGALRAAVDDDLDTFIAEQVAKEPDFARYYTEAHERTAMERERDAALAQVTQLRTVLVELWCCLRDELGYEVRQSFATHRAFDEAKRVLTAAPPDAPCEACGGNGTDYTDPEQPDQCEPCGGTGIQRVAPPDRVINDPPGYDYGGPPWTTAPPDPSACPLCSRVHLDPDSTCVADALKYPPDATDTDKAAIEAMVRASRGYLAAAPPDEPYPTETVPCPFKECNAQIGVRVEEQYAHVVEAHCVQFQPAEPCPTCQNTRRIRSENQGWGKPWELRTEPCPDCATPDPKEQ